MAKKSIVLLGQPTINEDGAAGEAIKPGHLVKGVSTILKHASAAGRCGARFALERDEFGQSLTSSSSTEAGSPDYATGDTVKVGAFHQGQRVLAWVASGQNITEDDLLESAGDGTLKEGSTWVIARALETLGAVTELTRVRVEII